MYAVATRTFLTNYPLFLIAALALAAVGAFGFDVSGGASVVVYGLIALYSHRMVILNESYGWNGKPNLPPGERMPAWAFLWRYGLFFLTLIMLVVAVFFKLLPNSTPDELKRIAALYFSMLIVSPFYAVFLTLLGTTLPAAAVGGDKSFRRALYRGRKRFFAT